MPRFVVVGPRAEDHLLEAGNREVIEGKNVALRLAKYMQLPLERTARATNESLK